MEIKLNSPKYAEAQSLQYQMYKKQADRKKRKNFVPELFERYFRRNEGTTDHATIPEVTLTSHFVIEFDLLVTSFAGGVKVMDGGTDGGSDRLDVNIVASGFFDVRDYFKSYVNGVAGATVALNQLNKIRIVRDATDVNQSTRFLDILLARVNNTGNNLPGILANLKIWDNGTLIRDYPLDDNSDDLRELASGQNGTVINGNASDWGLFQQQATGEWLGQELVPQPIEFSQNWNERGAQFGQGVSGNSFITVSTSGQGMSLFHNNVGVNLRVEYDVSCVDVFWNFNDWNSADAGELVPVISGNQSGMFDYIPSQSQIYLRHDTTDNITVTLNALSLKEVLNAA